MKKIRKMVSFLMVLTLLFTNCGLGNMQVEAAKKGSKKPTKITLSDSKKNLAVGETFTLKVKSVKPSNASKSVTWSSSNKKIATVNKKGKVTAKKTGSVTISAKSTVNKKVVAKCKIKVYKATKTLKLNSEKSYELTVGQTQTLSAKVTNPKKGAAPIEWSSSNKKVAKVSSKGKVTAVAEGKAIITAKSGKKKVKVSITVKAKEASNETGNTPGTGENQNPGTTPGTGENQNPGTNPGGTDSENKPSGDNPSGDDSPEDNPSGGNPSGDDPSGDDPSGDDPSGDKPSVDKTVFNRGEWVAALVDKMGYSISENSLPKDPATGVTVYSFLDIYGNENVMKIEAAVGNGIVPFVGGNGKRTDYFYPDENVTREFVAVTAVRALGYIADTAIDSSDIDYLQYPNEAKVAVDQGMFTLKDGAFAPDELVTGEEFAKIMEIVDASLAAWEYDPNHENVIEYKDSVVKCDQSFGDYTVSAENDKIKVTISGNSIAENTQVDQILLLPENEEFPDGLALKVESVSKVDDTVTIMGNMPNSFEEVFETVDFEAIGQIDVGNIVLAEGVSFVEKNSTYSGETLDQAGISAEESFPTGTSDELTLELGEEYGAVTLSYEFANIYCKFDYDKYGINEVVVKVPNSVGISYDLEKGWSGEKELGSIPVKLPAGFTIDVIVSLKAEINGEVHLVYSAENSFGVSYQKGGSLQKLVEYDDGFSGEINVEAKAGLGMTIELSWLPEARKALGELLEKEDISKPIYTVGAEFGLGADINVFQDSLDLNCADANIWMFLDFFVGEGDTIVTDLLPMLEYRWNIYDKETSPLKLNLHFENFQKVDVCSRGNGRLDITMRDDLGGKLSNVPLTLKSKESNQRYQYITDESGNIQCHLPAGTYEVIVTKSGMESYEEQVVLEAGVVKELEIILYSKDRVENVHAGTWNGITWSIDNRGKLTIGGVYIANTSNSEMPPWRFYYDSVKTAVVKVKNAQNTSEWFVHCYKLSKVDLNDFDTSKVTNMSSMFNGCGSLTTLDVSGFDTSKVTNMSSMFNGCSSLTTLDVSGFDTSKVGDMSSMFNGCLNLITLDVSGLDTSEVIDMSSMFSSCRSLATLDVSEFDTSKVTNMSSMFDGCRSLITLDVSGFNTSEVTDMESMFNFCENLKILDVSGFDTSKVTNMSSMFDICSSLTTLDVSGFDTSNVKNMDSMFNTCANLKILDVSGFDTRNVTDMKYMFNVCQSLTTLDVSNFDTRKVTNMASMFSGCSGLLTLDVSGFDTSNVTSMDSMFSGCRSLTTLDVSGFDTSKVTNMNSMFKNCKSLISLDLSGLDTSKVRNMSHMFNGCSSLITLNLSGLDMSKVRNMSYMFRGCNSLPTLDVSELDTSEVTDMSGIFYDCSGLKSLDLSGLDTSEVTTMISMFSGCSSLLTLNVSVLDTGKVTNMNYMFRGCSGLTTLDVSGLKTSEVTTMISMFSGCSSLLTLNVSELDTSKVTNMSRMFNGCSGLTTIDVSGLKTSEVTDMGYMFQACSGLKSLNVNGLDTSNVTYMGSMFGGCSSLLTLNVSELDTSNVTYMGSMFSGCSGLTTLDVSKLDTSKVTNMSCMFYGCSGLTTLDISGFDAQNVKDIACMFDMCNMLNTIKVPINVSVECDLPYRWSGASWQDSKGNIYTTLPMGLIESIEIKSGI